MLDMLTLVILSATVLCLVLCAMDMSNISIVHNTMDSIRSCLSPDGLTNGQLLTERSTANMRLVKAFNLSNTFVSNNPSIHSTFVKHARTLLDRSNRLGWLHFRDLSMQAVQVELSELDNKNRMPYDIFIQCVTLRVILIGLLGVDASVDSFAREDVITVTNHINRLWALSKRPENIPSHLLPQLNDALRRLIPDSQQYPNPVDFVIPAWETLWRVVAIAVAYSHQDEGMLDAFSSLYRIPGIKTFAGHGTHLSPKNIVDETMRLHPPSKHIGRMKTHPICRYLPPPILRFLQLIIPSRLSWKESADVIAIQHSADIWGPDAGQFKPSRFLTSAEPTKQQFEALKYVFGGGPLRCIGASWAPVAIGVVCSAVLTAVGEREDLRIVQGAEVGARDGWNECTMIPEASLGEKNSFLVNAIEDEKQDEASVQLSRGLELLKDAAPFRVVELALEIQVEKMRVVEATKARDAAVHRLLEAYTSVRRHSEIIEQLQKEREEHGLKKLDHCLSSPSECNDARILELEEMIADLRDINQCLKEYGAYERKMLFDPPPNYESEITRVSAGVQTDPELEKTSCDAHLESYRIISSKVRDVGELIQARNDMLATIPLPENAPDISLVPITLPPHTTLHEFLNSAPASLRMELGNFRVLHSTTATWCPEREEHGFMYVPMFKCNTNPRALTAHRWMPVDVIGRMNKPTECFFNNDGTWYYAGSYKAFWIDVVSTKEWEQLSAETISAIIKETLAGRKNTTPQNNYETGQLYAAGALKLACVALQCVGFSMDLYHSISELATKFTQAKWKTAGAMNSSNSMSPSAGSPSSSVVGTPPISSSTSSFSGIHGNIAHTAHFYGPGNSLLAQPQSKLNSPLSSHGSGPCTPNLPTSVISTPGISPVGPSMTSGGGGGLGTGSPGWNIASSFKLKSSALGMNTASNLGLQLSNIPLSPGATSGFTTYHHHHSLRGSDQLNSTADGLANNENLAPGTMTATSSPGLSDLLAGMTLETNSPHDVKVKTFQK